MRIKLSPSQKLHQVTMILLIIFPIIIFPHGLIVCISSYQMGSRVPVSATVEEIGFYPSQHKDGGSVYQCRIRWAYQGRDYYGSLQGAPFYLTARAPKAGEAVEVHIFPDSPDWHIWKPYYEQCLLFLCIFTALEIICLFIFRMTSQKSKKKTGQKRILKKEF